MNYQFESILPCMRKIKSLILEEEEDEITLIYHKHYEEYYITNNDYDITNYIEKCYRDWGMNESPDSHANEFEIIIYTNDVDYLGKDVDIKKSLLIDGFYRVKAYVEPEYSVDFNIMISRKENKI